MCSDPQALGVQWREITETLTPFWSQGVDLQLVAGAQVQVAVLTLTLGRDLPHLAQPGLTLPRHLRNAGIELVEALRDGPGVQGGQEEEAISLALLASLDQSTLGRGGLQGWLRRA